jgi:hypothetical protein
VAEGRPLCLLLLPGVLEEGAFARRGQDLMRSPEVVAIEPARRTIRRGADALAATQARRLDKRLPGVPRVVVVLDPRQYRLARAIIGRHRECELWYATAPTEPAGEAAELHELALARAAMTFDAADHPDQAAFQHNAPLWARLEELGIVRV